MGWFHTPNADLFVNKQYTKDVRVSLGRSVVLQSFPCIAEPHWEYAGPIKMGVAFTLPLFKGQEYWSSPFRIELTEHELNDAVSCGTDTLLVIPREKYPGTAFALQMIRRMGAPVEIML